MKDVESELIKRQARIKAALGELPEVGDLPEPKPPNNPAMASSAEGLAASVVLGFLNPDLNLPTQGVYEEFRKRTDAVQAGSMDVPERMLMSQAMALQAVFTKLIGKAAATTDIKRLQPLMQLALKAQSNCRVTLETLNEFKNPRSVAFVRQTNVAHGPQQVNNEMTPAPEQKRARGKSQPNSKTNELIEAGNGSTHLDTRTAPTAAGSYRALETVGTVNGPKKPTRKAEKLPKRDGARSTLESVA